jgi:hypothetical protein
MKKPPSIDLGALGAEARTEVDALYHRWSELEALQSGD